MYYRKPFVQFLVAHIERGQKVLNKREVSVLIGSPPLRRTPQRLIIIGFVMIDLLFKRHVFSRVSRKQRYNTLDFAEQNRVSTGMLRAPIGNPASKGIFSSELPIFSSQTGTQTVKTQFGTPAQKMQKEVRTDEWRTSFFADNLKSLRYSFRLSAPARGHDA